MEGKKQYLIGLFTGMIAMTAVYLGVLIFFPNLLAADEQQAGRFGVPQGQSSSESVFPSVGAKVDEILHVIQNFYLNEVDMDEMADKIFRAVVSLVGDPYTSYMDAAQFTQLMTETEGVYTGIGVQVTGDMETNRIIVVTPFEGSPGANSGILPGDAIIKVDGIDVFGERLREAVDMILGEAGTSVTLTIYRQYTDETLEKTIVRDVITVPTVRHDMLDGNIGYLRITQFDRVTTGQFTEAIEDLTERGMEGLILDLRNNPGGLMSEVVRITDMLVPQGLIVYTQDRHGNQRHTRTRTREYLGIPLVVIVNEGSASASEILGGAVRDHGVGKLVGMTTFGKGLVQNIISLRDGSAVRVTVEQYFTPSGFSIQGVGLTPDIEIYMPLELTGRLSQLTLEEDVQLSRAVEILAEMMEDSSLRSE